MARKTKKIRKSRGGVSLFSNKKPTRRSSSIRRSAEKRKKNLAKIMKAKQIDKLKERKCLAQYQRCMGVSRRRSN
jgi:hypothetical protein